MERETGDMATQEDMNDLLVRTELQATATRDAAIAIIQENRMPDVADWVILGLFAKITSGASGVRLLAEAGLLNEAMGLNRAIVETRAHLEVLVFNPVTAVATLRDKIAHDHEGVVPDDASGFLERFEGHELQLLATLFFHWARRQTQKVANAAHTSRRTEFTAVLEAPDVSETISADGTAALGPTIWGLLREQKHWHPVTFANYGSGTATLFEHLGMEMAYVVEFKFGSGSLHGSDFDDYLDQHLEIPPPQYPSVRLLAQQNLCRAMSIVDVQYATRLTADINNLGEEGNRLGVIST